MSVDRARAQRAIAEFLRALGHDPAQTPELSQTPELVTSAFADELLSGYAVDIEALLAEGATTTHADIVVLDSIAVTSMCPHHLLPSFGHATVAYRPGARLLGIGSVARLVDACARRLALQEQIGEHVVTALMQHAGARGAFCRLSLRHGCLGARGAKQPDARVVTQAAAGDLALPAAAAELALALAGARE